MYYKLNYNIYFLVHFYSIIFAKKIIEFFWEVVPLKILVFQEAHISEKRQNCKTDIHRIVRMSCYDGRVRNIVRTKNQNARLLHCIRGGGLYGIFGG